MSAGSRCCAGKPSPPLTVEDIRFTTQDGVLPIHPLAEDSSLAPGGIERIESLGPTDALSFTGSRKGLEIRPAAGFAGQRRSR